MRHARSLPRPWLSVAASAVAGIVGFVAVYTAAFVGHIDATITTIDVDALLGDDRPPAPVAPVDAQSGQPITILLMGLDRDAGRDAILNDTTILVRISADRSRVEAVSIPRDTMVQLPSCELSDGSTWPGGFAQFNSAYSHGGGDGSPEHAAACTIRAVEAITGVGVQHFIMADFDGFRAVVDAAGGVPMCIPADVRDAYSGTNLTAGPQVLNGRQALAYARMRHGTGLDGSDLGRIDRQQQLLKNLAASILTADLFYRPDDTTALVSAAAQALTMDEDLASTQRLVGLAFSLRNLEPATGIVFATAPYEAYPADHNKVQLTAAADDIWKALEVGDPIAPLLDDVSASPANETAPSTPDSAASPGTTPSTPPATGADAVLSSCDPVS